MAKKTVSNANWNIDYFNFLSVYVCPSVFSLFKTNRNLTYKQCFDLFLKMIHLNLNKKDAEWTMYASLYAHDLAVFRQNVCLIENIMKNSLVDLTSEQFKSRLKHIRNRVTIEGGETLSNYNFIKLIRNAFAHNNELDESPDLTFFDDPNEGFIKFKIEKPDEGIKLIMGTDDMDALCYSLVENTYSPLIPGSSIAVRPKRLRNALIGRYFDAEKINRYMQDINSDGDPQDIILDEHQKSAISNFFAVGRAFDDDFYFMQMVNKKPLGISLTNPALINILFPRTNNALTLATQNYICHYGIYGELQKNPNLTYDNLTTNFFELGEKSESDEKDFALITNYILNSPYSMFMEISTALTTICTGREITDLEDKYKSLFDEKTLRHIRNSMVHGTYFYDFKNNLHIYDGQRKLKYITSIEGMDMLYKIQELAQSRWRDTFFTMIKDNHEKE